MDQQPEMSPQPPSDDPAQQGAAGWVPIAAQVMDTLSSVGRNLVLYAQSLWRQFKEAPRSTQLGVGTGVGCGSLIVLLVICSCAAIAIGVGNPGKANSAHTAEQGTKSSASASPTLVPSPIPTHTFATLPTATAIPTATPLPPARPIQGAVFGGMQPAFVSKFGAPSDPSGPSWEITLNGRTADLDLAFISGNDGKQHVETMDVDPPPGDTWDATTAQAMFQVFLPPDATHVKDTTTSQGVDHVYHSNALAATFPASEFVDSNNQPVPPGTFDVQCSSLQPDGSGIGLCNFQTGDQPGN